MPLTGTWLQTSRYRQRQQTELHALDPEHDVYGAVDPNPDWQGEQYYPVEPAPDVVGLEWVTVAPGLFIDRTPSGHDTPSGHNLDMGAHDLLTRDEPTFQFSDERYDQTTTETQQSTGVSDNALRRGMTGEGLNNPPLASYLGKGWRAGSYRYNWTEHDYSPPFRYHDHRIVSPNMAARVGDVPPPVNPGPYNTPFRSLARAITNINRKPMMRRVPEPLGDAITQETVTVDPPVESWVMQ